MAGTIRLELISAVLETVILPLNYIPMVGETGFEPAIPWSQTKCVTKLRYSPIMAARAGFEPTNVGVKVRCVTISPSGNLEWETGLEPATVCLEGRDSTN